MALRFCNPLRLPLLSSICSYKSSRSRTFSVRGCILDDNESHKLVLEVKEKLDYSLPVGRNGRDDEDMILWFLKDRKFSVEDTAAKVTKAIKRRQEFGVSELTEDSVKTVAETGKAFVHDFLDVNKRPVLIVVASKHFPGVHDPSENEKLCVFLIEKALSKLPHGREEILGVFDLRGFGTKNANINFLTFLFDVFYTYYPKRLGEVLFVEAPFVFKPIWQLAKALLKSYASLNQLLEAKAQSEVEGSTPKTTDEIFDSILPPKSDYVCGLGPGPKQLEEDRNWVQQERKELEDRAKAAEQMIEELQRQREELKARQDSMEQTMLEKLRAEMRESMLQHIDTPAWIKLNTQGEYTGNI